MFSARQAKGNQRVSAKASHKAHANMAALYHHSDTENTHALGS